MPVGRQILGGAGNLCRSRNCLRLSWEKGYPACPADRHGQAVPIATSHPSSLPRLFEQPYKDWGVGDAGPDAVDTNARVFQFRRPAPRKGTHCRLGGATIWSANPFKWSLVHSAAPGNSVQGAEPAGLTSVEMAKVELSRYVETEGLYLGSIEVIRCALGQLPCNICSCCSPNLMPTFDGSDDFVWILCPPEGAHNCSRENAADIGHRIHAVKTLKCQAQFRM
jgi:hypothetical protein